MFLSRFHPLYIQKSSSWSSKLRLVKTTSGTPPQSSLRVTRESTGGQPQHKNCWD